MSRLYLLTGIVFMLVACNTQRMVCPAYQSSFMYDKEVAKQKFSYFQADSTPKVYTASKNKYLIAVPESYRRKYRRMQTVEMMPVYPVIPDSVKQQEEFKFAEMDPADSVSITSGRIEPGDSAYAITKTREKYNLDQDLYMWYFREVLVLPDVRAAIEKKAEQEAEAKAGPAKKEEKKKGIKGFFQNLFKKKPKSDPAITDPGATGVNSPPQPEEKKGGLFKKKKTEPAPEKKEGDGF